jgi:hypothetical protein
MRLDVVARVVGERRTTARASLPNSTSSFYNVDGPTFSLADGLGTPPGGPAAHPARLHTERLLIGNDTRRSGQVIECS